MPFKSSAQSAWGHTPEGIEALGGADKVKEWESSTDYKDLPKHVTKKKIKESIISKLTKNR